MTPLGRPRSPGLDEAAIRAASELLVEEGYHQLTMDRIAQRAAVSKAALYRRWPNKLALVIDALQEFSQIRNPVPDTGHLRDDVLTYLEGMAKQTPADAATLDALNDALDDNPELRQQGAGSLFAKVTSDLNTIITRGVERGELPADTDIDLLANAIPALLRQHRLTTGKRLDHTLITRIVTQFFPAT
jgi:AcrR family transcriptional regulator